MNFSLSTGFDILKPEDIYTELGMLTKLAVYSKLPDFQFICVYFPSLLKKLKKRSWALLFSRPLKFSL